jgi:hypothetical protein
MHPRSATERGGEGQGAHDACCPGCGTGDGGQEKVNRAFVVVVVLVDLAARPHETEQKVADEIILRVQIPC